MSKRKGARTRKARSSSKVRAKAGRSRIAVHHRTRANSKQARVLGLLSRSSGATTAGAGEILQFAERRTEGALQFAAVGRPAGGVVDFLLANGEVFSGRNSSVCVGRAAPVF